MKFNKLVLFVVFSVIICISMLSSVSAAGNNTTGLADSPYPTLGVDNGHSGQSNYTGPQTNTTKWKNSITGPSVIGSDGTIYVASSADNFLYALNSADGTVKWNVSVTGPRGLVVGNNNTLYVVSSDSTGLYGLYAYSSNGTYLWSCPCNVTDAPGSSVYPLIASDGTIYFGWSTHFFAVNSDGTPKWSNVISTSYRNAAIGSNGTIYVLTGGNTYSYFYGFNPDGTVKFNIYTKGGDGVAIGPDGTLYGVIVQSGTKTNGYLTAFCPNCGNKIWQNTSYANIMSVPVIASDGTIYVAETGGSYGIDAFDSKGNLKWHYGTIDRVQQKFATIGADGTLYIGDNSGNIYAMNPNGSSVKWTYSSGQSFNSAMIGSDGTLYVVTAGGIIAIQDFTADFKEDTSNLSANFTDTSSNLPTTWAWDFNSDGIIDSTEQNPTYAYSKSGWYVVTLVVTNGFGDSSTAIKSIHVNQAPTLNPIGEKNVTANKTLNFTVSGSDPDGDTLTYSATNLPTGATFDSSTGVFSWTPTVSQIGSYVVTFNVFDGVSTASEDVTINVKANSAPVLDAINDKSVDENQSLNFTVSGNDLDGDSLNYSATGLPTGATFDSSTGAFSWTPSYNQAGTYTVTFTVSDGNLTDNKTVTITVNNVNRGPTIGCVSDKTVDENKKLTFSVCGDDLDGDSLTYSATGLPSGATFNTKTGAFSWTPSYSQAGTYTVTFTVSDGKLTHSKTMRITVNNVDNVAPKVTKIDPARYAIINNTRKVISVTFSEVVKKGTGLIALKNSKGVAVSSKMVVSGNKLTITPTKALANGIYTVLLSNGSVTDNTGNKLAAYTSKFTVDTVVPKVTKIDPVKYATIKNTSKVITVTFNEAVKKGTGLVALKNSKGVIVSSNVAVSGNKLTITPTKKLTNGTYTVLLSYGSVADNASNKLATYISKFAVKT